MKKSETTTRRQISIGLPEARFPVIPTYLRHLHSFPTDSKLHDLPNVNTWRITSRTSEVCHSLPGHMSATVPSAASKIVFRLCVICVILLGIGETKTAG